MKTENIYDLISVDPYSMTPKYIQVTNSIVKGIEEGRIKSGSSLPSINTLSYEFDISRSTVEKTYLHLKKIGVINSVRGKGYFIAQSDIKPSLKVFLIFNKLSVHKKMLYDSFSEALGDRAMIDFYIYNNDFALFKKLLLNNKNNYTHFVIVPHFLDHGNQANELINSLGGGKVILLDKMPKGIRGAYGAVYENFEQDIFKALTEALPRLQKYHTLKIIFPERSYFPEEILTGFYSFCREYAYEYKVVSCINTERIQKGEVFINLMEDDLLSLLDVVRQTDLTIGKDVGIISYNETPWKRYLLNGITTISTDFKKMGEMAAEMVLRNDQKQRYEVPFTLCLRDSL